MRTRLFGAFMGLLLGFSATHAHANDTIVITTSDVTTNWRNINEIVLVLAGGIALDEEWVQELRDLQAESGLAADPQGLDAAIAAFRERLAAALDAEGMTPTPLPTGEELSDISARYVRSGVLLDDLVRYLIHTDTLASVAVYYTNADEVKNATDQELAAAINLATQRLDAFLEESGF